MRKPLAAVHNQVPARLDIKKELAELAEIAGDAADAPKKQDGDGKADKAQKPDKAGKANGVASPEKAGDGMITIDEFFKTELCVVDIEECVKVEKSNKLLKLTVFDGARRRTIVSGIANAYAPDELVGTKATLVANLKPAKLCGITSEGMLLCSVGEDGVPRLVRPTGKAGDKIC